MGNSLRLSSDFSLAWMLVYAAWAVAAGATLAAIFFSEVMGLPPCLLCWYQRICMFALALLLPLGLTPYDPRIVRYALPFAVIGLVISLFHQALVAGWVPKEFEPCARGVPCAQTVIEWFGFLTIPWLSIAAFAAIIALLLLARMRSRA